MSRLSLKGNLSLLALAGVLAYCMLQAWLRPVHQSITWDVVGYYMYLPKVLMEGDPHLEHPETIGERVSADKLSGTYYQAYSLPDGKWVYKYSMGMAMLYLPFFLIGHLLAWLGSWPMDGWSWPYHFALHWGGLISLVMGLALLRGLLRKWVSEGVTALTLLLLFFGTNMMVMSQNSAAQPHFYLFGAYALILWLTQRWHERPRLLTLLALAGLCGICILARPSEAICLLIPLLWGMDSWAGTKAKWGLVLRKSWQLPAALAALVFLPQIWSWNHTAGHWPFYSYHYPEKLHLSSPHLWPFLFSYRKGWLLYTPVMALALLGLLRFRQLRSSALAVGLFMLANLWVVSSWTVWWYADSFSSRAMVQSYAVAALPLAMALQWLGDTLLRKWVGGAVVGLLVLLNLWQSTQFLRGVISPDRMTKEYYWYAFTKLDVSQPEKRSRLLVNRDTDGISHFTPDSLHRLSASIQTDYDTQLLPMERRDSFPGVWSGKYGIVMDLEHPYSMSMEKPLTGMLGSKGHCWVKVKAKVCYEEHGSGELRVVTEMVSTEGKSYFYMARGIPRDSLGRCIWQDGEVDYLSPEARHSDDDVVKVYLWYVGEGRA